MGDGGLKVRILPHESFLQGQRLRDDARLVESSRTDRLQGRAPAVRRKRQADRRVRGFHDGIRRVQHPGLRPPGRSRRGKGWLPGGAAAPSGVSRTGDCADARAMDSPMLDLAKLPRKRLSGTDAGRRVSPMNRLSTMNNIGSAINNRSVAAGFHAADVCERTGDARPSRTARPPGYDPAGATSWTGLG